MDIAMKKLTSPAYQQFSFYAWISRYIAITRILSFYVEFSFIFILLLSVFCSCGEGFQDLIIKDGNYEKSITSFKFSRSKNLVLTSDVNCVINENTIETTVTYNTDITSLTPDIEYTSDLSLFIEDEPANLGWLFRNVVDGSTRGDVYTSDHTDPKLRPYLEVEVEL